MTSDAHLTAFFREIKDHPDDDVPRLVLADFLQDRGDPRGEFVHAQVMRARLPESDPHAETLYRRERQLLREHVFAWLGPLADFASGWSFERGLVRVELRGDGRREPVVPDLTACEAIRWVESATLRAGKPADLALVSRSGLLAQLSRLVLDCKRFLQLSPLWRLEAGGLRSLLVCGTLFAEGEVDRLAEAAPLAGLRYLNLSDNRLGDAAALALAASVPLRNLNRLDLANNSFSSVGREALDVAFGDRVRFR